MTYTKSDVDFHALLFRDNLRKNGVSQSQTVWGYFSHPDKIVGHDNAKLWRHLAQQTGVMYYTGAGKGF